MLSYEPYDPSKHGRPTRAPRNTALAELFAAVRTQGPMVVEFDDAGEMRKFKHMLYAVARHYGLEITAWSISPTQFVIGLRGRDKFTKS